MLLVPLVVVFMAIIPAVCTWPEYPGAVQEPAAVLAHGRGRGTPYLWRSDGGGYRAIIDDITINEENPPYTA